MSQMITQTTRTANKGEVVVLRNMHFVFVLLSEVGKMNKKIKQISTKVNKNL